MIGLYPTFGSCASLLISKSEAGVRSFWFYEVSSAVDLLLGFVEMIDWVKSGQNKANLGLFDASWTEVH